MLSPAEFDQVVEEALRRIPKRFRQKIENVAIVVEAEPRQSGLLGLYEGRPLTERSVYDGFRMPDKITIYQGPHERLSHTREELEQMWRTPCGTRSRTTSAWTNGAFGAPNVNVGPKPESGSGWRRLAEQRVAAHTVDVQNHIPSLVDLESRLKFRLPADFIVAIGIA